MKDLLLSVVIPTYNRKESLKRVLEAFNYQSISFDEFEVVVVDDGSLDGTQKLLDQLKSELKYSLRNFYQQHKGPSAARNLGIKEAKGEIILFLGDDIVPHKNLIEEHLKMHKDLPENIAVLGLVEWPPEVKKTPLMEYLDNGVQFSYSRLKGKTKADFNCFWTANISVKKSFLLKHGVFDEEFCYPAHEDTELGYRLIKRGLEILYNPYAIGYNYHYVTLKSYIQKHIYIGRAIVKFSRKYPELPPHPDMKEVKKIFYWKYIKLPIAIGILPFAYIFKIKKILFICYNVVLNYYKLKGISMELKSKNL